MAFSHLHAFCHENHGNPIGVFDLAWCIHFGYFREFGYRKTDWLLGSIFRVAVRIGDAVFSQRFVCEFPSPSLSFLCQNLACESLLWNTLDIFGLPSLWGLASGAILAQGVGRKSQRAAVKTFLHLCQR